MSPRVHWSVIAHQLLTNLRPDREPTVTDTPPAADDEYTALKDRAEHNARRLAAEGMDPAEATVRGYGQAVGDQHRLRCPDHAADRCVDDPGPVSDVQAAEGRRRILDRLRPRVDPDLEARAARTVEHLRGDR